MSHSLKQQALIRSCIVAAIILFVVGYAASRSIAYVSGPTLEVLEPSNNAIVEGSLVTVRGDAKRVSKLTLNGREIFTNEEGYFEERLVLPPGYTIMTLTAEDRFNRETSETLHLIRK